MLIENKELSVCVSSSDVARKLRSVIEQSFSEFRKSRRERFTVALSGAGMITTLSDVIPSISSLSAEDWETWLIFFVDERLVPVDHEESTYSGYLRKLIPKSDHLKQDQFVAIDPSLAPAECASDYEHKLRAHVVDKSDSGFGRIDLILLGFGPDGHTGSLFPGHPLLGEETKWIASITDSPKPPPTRVTFTLPLINAACDIVVLGTGSSKQEIVHRVFVGHDHSLPVNMVSTSTGRKVVWIVDHEAAKLITH